MRAIAQVALLSLVFLGCDAATRALRLPLPGNVVGALVLAAALLFGVVPLRWVEEGGDLLLRHLPLFFVPAAVLSMRFFPIVRAHGLAIALVMGATTALVMIVTGLLASRMERR